jgi:hypothetical protein
MVTLAQKQQNDADRAQYNLTHSQGPSPSSAQGGKKHSRSSKKQKKSSKSYKRTHKRIRRHRRHQTRRCRSRGGC